MRRNRISVNKWSASTGTIFNGNWLENLIIYYRDLFLFHEILLVSYSMNVDFHWVNLFPLLLTVLKQFVLDI